MAWNRRPRPKDQPVTEDPRSYLLKALGSRDYSRAQLESKLKERGHPPDRIAAAIQEFIDAGLFREESFASARVRAFLSKGRGPTWIKAKLRSERVEVDDDLIAAAYEHLGFTQEDQVRDLIRKLMNSSKTKAHFEEDERAARTRLLQGVVARGHPFAMAMRLFDALKKDPY